MPQCKGKPLNCTDACALHPYLKWLLLYHTSGNPQQIHEAPIIAESQSTTQQFHTKQIVRDRKLGTETKASG